MCVMGQNIKDIQNTQMNEPTGKERLQKFLFDLEGVRWFTDDSFCLSWFHNHHLVSTHLHYLICIKVR